RTNRLTGRIVNLVTVKNQTQRKTSRAKPLRPTRSEATKASAGRTKTPATRAISRNPTRKTPTGKNVIPPSPATSKKKQPAKARTLNNGQRRADNGLANKDKQQKTKQLRTSRQ